MGEELKGPKGTIKIEENVLVVNVPLDQSNGKIIAKGLLLDAVNIVDEYFMMLKLHQRQKEQASGVIIPGFPGKPNGGTHGV